MHRGSGFHGPTPHPFAMRRRIGKGAPSPQGTPLLAPDFFTFVACVRARRGNER